MVHLSLCLCIPLLCKHSRCQQDVNCSEEFNKHVRNMETHHLFHTRSNMEQYAVVSLRGALSLPGYKSVHQSHSVLGLQAQLSCLSVLMCHLGLSAHPAGGGHYRLLVRSQNCRRPWEGSNPTSLGNSIPEERGKEESRSSNSSCSGCSTAVRGGFC